LFRLFEGSMGVALVVGIAAVGVIAFRAIPRDQLKRTTQSGARVGDVL
jgi:hypothetical protein